MTVKEALKATLTILLSVAIVVAFSWIIATLAVTWSAVGATIIFIFVLVIGTFLTCLNMR